MRHILIVAIASSLAVGAAFAQTATTTTETEQDVFIIAKPTDVLSYNLVGLDIHGADEKAIGQIKDLIVSDGTLTGYIVSVGGFLGVAERYVIVSPASVQVNYSENDKKWTASMTTTKAALEKAPEFKYEGRWAR